MLFAEINALISEASKLKYVRNIDNTSKIGKLINLSFEELERINLMHLTHEPLNIRSGQAVMEIKVETIAD